MEIYRNSSEVVAIEVPTEVKVNVTSIDVFVLENGRQILELDTVVSTPTGYSVALPWSLVRQDRDFIVNWKITYEEAGSPVIIYEQNFVQVVTPLISLDETAKIAGYDVSTDEGLSDTQDLERRVRYAIQAYTGQNFGRFYASMAITGNGGDKLNLPAPLLTFNGILFDGILRPNAGIRLINDGWAISGGGIYIDSIKQAPPEWILDRFDYQGKIYPPVLYGHSRFIDGVEYVVDGVWGYHDVPLDVRQAARILTQDYSCDESLWRDRYIKSVRAGDWRFEFSEQAFSMTGNVQADQLLSGYRRATMAVI